MDCGTGRTSTEISLKEYKVTCDFIGKDFEQDPVGDVHRDTPMLSD